jgi:acyl-coenzyme A thioesterase PaaI-like protein
MQRGMSELSQRLQDALADAASDGRRLAPVSFTIDYGMSGDAASAGIEARVDRSTKSLVFASAEARMGDGRTAATASAVYRVTL